MTEIACCLHLKCALLNAPQLWLGPALPCPRMWYCALKESHWLVHEQECDERSVCCQTPLKPALLGPWRLPIFGSRGTSKWGVHLYVHMLRDFLGVIFRTGALWRFPAHGKSSILGILANNIFPVAKNIVTGRQDRWQEPWQRMTSDLFRVFTWQP